MSQPTIPRWECPECGGTEVPIPGRPHKCARDDRTPWEPRGQAPLQRPQDGPPNYTASLDRIAAAIERAAKALERIADRMK
jgi:hypothetical protein